MTKKTLLIDLDGVLNTYNGSFNKDFIPSTLNGAKKFLQNLSKKFEIKIFTTRNKLLTAKWLIQNDLDSFITDITDKKELSWLYIDDRCIQFKGDFEKLTQDINNFQPWYKINAVDA